ncbi:hypothetical protein [Sulfurimonas sp.]|jgi:wyosine [tRNA(Phe)-imidazoG37] synthetase (radical SAM superfamily)|uniref:hypothetical protein n=1 Tax=Sulfurimonas sp. TaxID=2022749 RepID=UPI0025D8531B|nr:hypothetical protein [Sulfurimonas sp.]MCK9473715.1 hypothetical protein [Sulfurimonas sp.]MDD3506183.1 hypothetical protein [Sulfurimonas sp.]
MNVTSTSSMQQIRKMDGSGGGQGQGGMRDIMQSLPTEDKNKMIEQLSLMNKEDRAATVAQMKDVDASTLSSQNYAKALLDILDKANTNKAETEGFSVYA